MPYLPAPPDTTVTARPALRHLLSRVRMGAIETQLLDNARLLDLFTEAYQRACERALRLLTIDTIVLSAGVREYALPADHFQTLAVYRDGAQLERLSLQEALREDRLGYYEVGDLLGVSPIPPEGTNPLWLLYAQTPAAFPDLDAQPDLGFGAEFHHALVHFARWRAGTLAGGAAKVGQARWEREQYDAACLRLRARRVDGTRLSRMAHLGYRRQPAYAPEIDAR